MLSKRKEQVVDAEHADTRLKNLYRIYNFDGYSSSRVHIGRLPSLYANATSSLSLTWWRDVDATVQNRIVHRYTIEATSILASGGV